MCHLVFSIKLKPQFFSDVPALGQTTWPTLNLFATLLLLQLGPWSLLLVRQKGRVVQNSCSIALVRFL
jgi:hypothetical protein